MIDNKIFFTILQTVGATVNSLMAVPTFYLCFKSCNCLNHIVQNAKTK